VVAAFIELVNITNSARRLAFFSSAIFFHTTKDHIILSNSCETHCFATSTSLIIQSFKTLSSSADASFSCSSPLSVSIKAFIELNFSSVIFLLSFNFVIKSLKLVFSSAVSHSDDFTLVSIEFNIAVIFSSDNLVTIPFNAEISLVSNQFANILVTS
jgi:hypothetical protein